MASLPTRFPPNETYKRIERASKEEYISHVLLKTDFGKAYMDTLQSSGHEIYIRITTPKLTRIESRVVWDTDRFLRSMNEQYAKLDADPKTAREGPHILSIATRAEYLQQIKRA